MAILGLPNFSNAAMPCALCRTSLVGSNTWSNFKSDAPWRLQCWSHRAWLAWPGRCSNPLFSLPGVSALTINLDYLHSKYLGTDQYCFGSTLAILTCTGLMPGSPEENIQALYEEFKRYYALHKTPSRHRYLNRLTMFLRQSGCPKLRGKAAEIKWFGGALLSSWEKWMNPALSVHRDIQVLLKMNVFMEEILNNHKNEVSLPEEEAALFEECCATMLTLHGKLAVHFADEEILAQRKQ